MQQAWRTAKRQPAETAAKLTSLIVQQEDTIDTELSDVDIARASMLLGKIEYESLGEFDAAWDHLEAAVLGDRTYLPGLYHQCKLAYCRFDYAHCWTFCANLIAEVFPCLLQGAGSIPSVEKEAVACKYHRAVVLLLCILSVLMPNHHQATARLIEHISGWLEKHRSQMARQFDAELRFADLIMRLSPFPSPERPVVSRRIFALGDSHSLTLAWSQLTIRGTNYFIEPRLSIGLKAWHFNPVLVRSREHHILLRHAQSIPAGSTVLVFAGEIDLRHDGPLFQSPRFKNRSFKYESSSAGVVFTVNAFVKGLVALADSCQHHYVVLPVRPPSESSPSAYARGVIPVWNAQLAKQIAEVSSPNVVYAGHSCSTALCRDPEGAYSVIEACEVAEDLEEILFSESSNKHLLLDPELDLGDCTHMNRAVIPRLAGGLELIRPLPPNIF